MWLDVAALRRTSFNHQLLFLLHDYSDLRRKTKPSSSLSGTRRHQSLPLKTRLPCEKGTLFSNPSWHSHTQREFRGIHVLMEIMQSRQNEQHIES